MHPNAQERPSVSLVAVDEPVLAKLVAVASTSATAGEVTPALTPGNDWNPQRIAWLERFHRERRGGLDGPKGEATWAVVVDGWVVGSVRLKALPERHVVETGIWLARSARGRGIGRQAVASVLDHAAGAGAHEVRAETTPANRAAQGLLRSLGFELVVGGEDKIRGRLAPLGRMLGVPIASTPPTSSAAAPRQRRDPSLPLGAGRLSVDSTEEGREGTSRPGQE